MSNIFGNSPLKIAFDWYGETKTIEFNSSRIEASYKLNEEVTKIHKSVLNGVIIKEHLGYYHTIKAHFHDISADEFSNIFQYLQVVDQITVYPFRDNPDFSFTAIIDKEKAYPYEYDDISTLPTSYFLECESDLYQEMIFKPSTMFYLPIQTLTIPIEKSDMFYLPIQTLTIPNPVFENYSAVWDFINGSLLDKTDNNVNLTNDGGILTTGLNDKPNSAYSYLSKDRMYTQEVSPIQITGDLTFHVLCYLNTLTGTSTYSILGCNGGASELSANNWLYSINITGSNFLQFFHEYNDGVNEFTTTNYTPPINTWLLISVVRDTTAKTYTLYVDGTLIDSYSYDNNPTGGSQSRVYLGEDPGSFVALNGKISFTAIKPEKESQEQITTMYNYVQQLYGM